MTRDETKKILMVIQAAYPSYKPDNKSVAVDTWLAMLSGYSYTLVSEAVKAYMAAEPTGFAPSIGQVIDKIYALEHPLERDGMEEWQDVMCAIRDGAYHSRQGFDSLSPTARRAIGSPEQIRAMAIDENFNESVARSNFLKAFDRVKGKEREIAKYPQSVTDLISDTVKKLEAKI